MSAPHPKAARPRPRRVVVLAAVAVVLLGVFVAITIDSMRHRPTGITALDLVVHGGAAGPGVGYSVDLVSAREGYPVVVHVDADGFPSLLFPTAAVAHLPANTRVRLPDPRGSAAWWAEADDRATVLTVLSENPPGDVDRLVELVERAATRAEDADEALRNVTRVLRRRLGEPVARSLGPVAQG